MQFAKDSFYVVLCDRLSHLNPQRTMVLNGTTRPAVAVTENEFVTTARPLECVFLLHWGGAQLCKGYTAVPGGLTEVECAIAYGTSGSREDGIDRGRLLATLDSELLKICSPPFTNKQDYTTPETTSLGSNIFWSSPKIELFQENANAQGISVVNKGRIPLFHIARTTVFFYPEVG